MPSVRLSQNPIRTACYTRNTIVIHFVRPSARVCFENKPLRLYIRNIIVVYIYNCQVHQALFPVEELEALESEFRRDEEMREKEEERVAVKRQQFEESLVGAPVRCCFLY